MKRLAFTLLELVFVIIVIGILAVLAMPNFSSNPLQQAAMQVAEHIRYTQHLAMVDDKFDQTDPTWWQKRWQMRFPHTTINGIKVYYYEVFSDDNKAGNSNLNEEAVDPLTGQTIGDGVTAVATIPDTSLVNLTKRFGVTSVTGTCVLGGAYRTIAFDNLGRPYLDVYTDIYSNVVPAGGCTIVLNHPDGTATITVQEETGLVSISYP
ncbi:MAG: prepilin-type N-terminal cleavage/methylation domain-containing protein [Sulfuricurvum sp.]|uniref:pilus assembly FimT family protein n=1 Tax=Sulfuricurvum sp. TaxID=2025608 RepID=UPI0025E2F41B|nr:prepilin-type N-terminal cleavage/methylation domain-containing protein [Sulfuricurvum sp.]MCK9374470.1 prepilin-type N-terminal cleavage/methylation domain-containing protein [Sulfuricurvum sp.]